MKATLVRPSANNAMAVALAGAGVKPKADPKPTKPKRGERWFRAWLKDGSDVLVVGKNRNDAFNRMPAELAVKVRDVVDYV